MQLPNIYTPTIVSDLTQRLQKIAAETPALWGKMDAAQMMAHLNKPYEIIMGENTERPNAFMRFILKMIAKNTVVNEVPYKQNTPTAPGFVISGTPDIEAERARLLAYMNRVVSMGEAQFEQMAHGAFGPLSAEEWNNLMYKHLDHHLRQFGA